MIWIPVALLSLAAIVLLLSYSTFRICFYSPKDRTEDPYSPMHGKQYEAVKDSIIACTRKMDEAPCEWVHITSFDGTELYGRYYHLRDGAPVQIIFHGYRSFALRDSAGGTILGQKMGFNVLAVDQRAHARSGGNIITFGIQERKDCRKWCEYAADRCGKDTPIVISGLSMGAATVLMASNMDLPQNVCGIMADCPYSDPGDIIRKVCLDEHYPDKLVYPLIKLGARVFGGFDLEETSAIQAVSQAKLPVLLLHGEDDRFVPCEMSRKIFQACASPAKLYTFPNAGHGLCYMVDPKRYEQVTAEFLWEIPCLKPYLRENPFTMELMKDKMA